MNSSRKVDLKVDWCSHAAAKYAVEHWHYSKRMPKSRQSTIGAREDGLFIGAVMFGDSICPYLGNAYKLNRFQVTELVRVALKEHSAPVSKIVRVAMRMIKRRNPKLRLLVSYADPSHSHHGGIYQAMGWIYVGESSAMTQYYWRGQWRNDSKMFDYFKTHKQEKEQCSTRRLSPKYKYLYGLDRQMKRQIELLSKPYPKRVTEGSVSNPMEIGGSTPTRPLQIAELDFEQVASD